MVCPSPKRTNPVHILVAKPPTEGPAGAEASFDFCAAFNATAARMTTAALRSRQAAAACA
jgi:hypothetical protein